MDGLDRVDHDQVGLHLVDRGEHVGEGRLGEQPQPVTNRTEPLGPQPHLLGRLFGGDVQRGARPLGQELQQDRALADPGFAAEQRDRPGHDAPTEHPVELADLGRPGCTGERIDLADPHRRRGRRPDRRRAAGHDHLFDQGVPLPARRALPRPLRVRGTAVGAHMLDLHLRHAASLTQGCDIAA